MASSALVLGFRQLGRRASFTLRAIAEETQLRAYAAEPVPYSRLTVGAPRRAT